MSYVYLIAEGEEGPVKIGVSKNPGWRICELQSGNPRKLKLIHCWLMMSRSEAFEFEQKMLRQLAERRMAGEWIDADVDFIRDLIETDLEEVVE